MIPTVAVAACGLSAVVKGVLTLNILLFYFGLQDYLESARRCLRYSTRLSYPHSTRDCPTSTRVHHPLCLPLASARHDCLLHQIFLPKQAPMSASYLGRQESSKQECVFVYLLTCLYFPFASFTFCPTRASRFSSVELSGVDDVLEISWLA